MGSIKDLYSSLKQRKRPEDVAQDIVYLLDGQLLPNELSVLHKAASNSLAKNIFGYTSMAQEFATTVGAKKQIEKALEIFKLDEFRGDYDMPESIERFIRETSATINKGYGQNDFKADRLNKAQRANAGLDLSKRNYNKKWRLLKRLEKRLLKIAWENRKNEFQMIAKHGLPHRLTYESFSADINTACFIAYYTARCNLRSVFTNQSQVKPFDEICQVLYDRCKKQQPATTNWLAMAYSYTVQEVLSHLSDEQKGALLGQWTTVLQDIASLLAEVWNQSDINRQTMIVKRGNDSTTWNNAAGAWNKARDNWINLIYSLGLDDILNDICFGKVMRLMAADVAAWHRMSGGGLDPNTVVWSKLALPWNVFEGRETCNRRIIEHFCAEAGIDPVTSGWIAPRVHGIASFTPTPELVHGVVVSNPFLASVLKKNNYYSGKNAKPFYPENN